VLEGLVRELTESGPLSFHTGNIAESRRLNIPRTAYYWCRRFCRKAVAMMLGCYDIYLWNEMMRPDSDVVFVGDARNVVAHSSAVTDVPPSAESREAELA
jgi:hypothetical protein